MRKVKKLLSILLTVALLITTVSVAFSAFAVDANGMAESIDAYTGNGISEKKKDPAFKALADEYVKLTSAQKEDLGLERVIKMGACAYNYVKTEFVMPDDTPAEDQAKGKNYVMWTMIGDMIGFTDAQKEAYEVVPYLIGNVAFVPEGETLSVQFNKLTFDAAGAEETAQGKANEAGLKQILKLYNDASDLAKDYIDRPYYSSGYFYNYTYSYNGFSGAKALLAAEYKYETAKLTVPAVQEPVAPAPPALSAKEADLIAQIDALKQQRKDEGKTVMADQELYRKMTKLQTELDEYRLTEKSQYYAGEEYTAYLEKLEKYEQDYRDYYYTRNMEFLAAPYTAAENAIKLSKDCKEALSVSDALMAAISAFEKDPSKIDAVTKAAADYMALPEVSQKFLKAFYVNYTGKNFSRLAKAASYIKTGVVAFDNATIAKLAAIFVEKDKVTAYQDLLKSLDGMKLPLSVEQTAQLITTYNAVDSTLRAYLNPKQAVNYQAVALYADLGNVYPAQNQEKPQKEIDAFVPTDVKYDFGATEQRVGEMVDVLDTTVLDLMASGGFGKEEIYKMIFTNANLTQLMMTIMPMLEELAAGMEGLEGGVLRGAITPEAFAKQLKEADYAGAAAAMKALASWSNPTEEQKAAYLASSYGFADGDAQAFVQAFTAHLRGLWGLLGIAGIKLDDTYKNGQLTEQGLYSAVVVPLFEALGVKDFPSPAEYTTRVNQEYAANGTKDAYLLGVFEPLIGFVDQILESPVNEALALLPNLVYQLDSGNIGKILVGAFDHLGSIGAGIDPSVKETITGLNSGMLYDLINNLLQQGFDIPPIEGLTTETCHLSMHISKDLWDKFAKDLAHCGTAVALPSKSVENAYHFSVEANKADVLVTALNFVLDAAKENRADWGKTGNNELEKLLFVVTGMTNKMILQTAADAILPKANYSAVTEAVNSIPKDLSIYTDASVAKVNEAKDAIVYGMSNKHQDEVDAMAKALKDAVKGLEKKPVEPTKPTDPTNPTDPTTPTTPDESTTGGNGGGEGSGGNGDSPKTGDKLLAVAGLTAISAAAAFLLTRKKKED